MIKLRETLCANCSRYLRERIDAMELHEKITGFSVRTVTLEVVSAVQPPGAAHKASLPAQDIASMRYLAWDDKESRGTYRLRCGKRKYKPQVVFSV